MEIEVLLNDYTIVPDFEEINEIIKNELGEEVLPLFEEYRKLFFELENPEECEKLIKEYVNKIEERII